MKPHRCLQRLLLLTLLVTASGCVWLGMASRVLPPDTIAPAYNKLEGQTVGVMVWADRGVRIDWNTIQLDIASSLQDKLEKADPKLLKNAHFPVKAASIVRFQKDHPELEGTSVTDIAPRL